MPTTAEVLAQLKDQARPRNLSGMASYGMSIERRLGVSIPDLRKTARRIGKNHKLALALWKTGIADARILASMIAVPEELTEREMDAWVSDLDSWDVCDQLCMNLLEKAPLARRKISEWSEREEEFVKRVAFAMIACLAWHDKQAADQQFVEFLPLIRRSATDDRNYVKKAVSWALRNIGKRGPHLRAMALRTAKEIQRADTRAARWVAADVIRELVGRPVRRRSRR